MLSKKFIITIGLITLTAFLLLFCVKWEYDHKASSISGKCYWVAILADDDDFTTKFMKGAENALKNGDSFFIPAYTATLNWEKLQQENDREFLVKLKPQNETNKKSGFFNRKSTAFNNVTAVNFQRFKASTIYSDADINFYCLSLKSGKFRAALLLATGP